MDDQTLLRQYVRHRSETASAELVERHFKLVYSAALRRVGEPYLAQDVARDGQAVLARRALEKMTAFTSRDLVRELDRAIQEMRFNTEAPELTTDGTLPATFFIQTRNNRNGILQITGFTENPRGVKIRYKLVQSGKSN